MSESLQKHREAWKDCGSCNLGKTRCNVVTFRHFGKKSDYMKCDVLFLGQYPDATEDILGKPFLGIPGLLMLGMINFCKSDYPDIRFAGTNIVACTTENSDGKATLVKNFKTYASACEKRLSECIRGSEPEVIICLGSVVKTVFPGGITNAKKTFPTVRGVEQIVTPRYLLNQVSARQETEIAKCQLKIQSILRKYF